MFRFGLAQVGRRAELRMLDDDLGEPLRIEFGIDLTEDLDASILLRRRVRLLDGPGSVGRQGRFNPTPMVKRSPGSLRKRRIEDGDLAPVLEQRFVGMRLMREVVAEQIPLLGRAQECEAKMALSPTEPEEFVLLEVGRIR